MHSPSPRLRPPLLAPARRLPRYDGWGLAFAAWFACLSLTPSLLPRSPGFQGWLSGIVAAAGYALGTFLHRSATRVHILASRRSGRVPPPAAGQNPARSPSPEPAPSTEPARRNHPRVVAAGWGLLAVGAPGAIGVFLVAARGWQREAHRLVGRDVPGPFSPVLIVSVMAGTFVILVGFFRILGRATRWLDRRLERYIPVVLTGVASIALVAVTLLTVFEQVVLRATLAGMDRVAAATNDEIPDGATAPTAPTRSGSSPSLINWRDLGYEGRVFVSGGPTDQELQSFSGKPPASPIRAYVGLLSAEDAKERAALAVAELERTHAFDRKVLCVVTTTGTGWVDDRSASALEYLYNGDTAIVATQYSYLPSPVSFVFDDDAVELEGATLFGAIQKAVNARPTDQRPKLLVYGESLGSNGGQAAFGGLDSMRLNTDGALFVGPPSSNALWSKLVRDRDRGSPERLPTYRREDAVRFAADPTSLAARPQTPWRTPRVLFLQHADDPVVWWSPSLLLRRPDWLSEARGPGVSPSMSWYPIVTFWQVTADLVAANHVPRGNGHRYGNLIAQGWAAVVPPPGWTTADTQRLAAVVP